MSLVKLLFFILIVVLFACLIVILSKNKKVKDTMIDLEQLQDKKTNLNFIARPFPSTKPPILRKCMGKNQCY